MTETDPVAEAERPELITSTYPDEASAKAGFDALTELQKNKEVWLGDVALVVRDEANTLHVREPDDMAAPEGAFYGGTIGAVLGMFAGPLGLVVGGAIGALVGGAAAQASDADVQDEWLKELGLSLQPGTGMVVAVTTGMWVQRVTDTLSASGGKVMTRPIDAELARQMGLTQYEDVAAQDQVETDTGQNENAAG